MKTPRVSASTVALAFALSTAGVAQEPSAAKASKPARTPSKLPAPILAAFQAAYPHATIKSVTPEKEDGKVVWEVESVDNGLGRDLVYDQDGTVVEVEEELPTAELPAPVTAAIKAHFPGATITKGEKVTRGVTISYELELKGATTKGVELTPDGKPVSK